jgi:Cu/Ag efflux protein CusF
MKPLYTLLVACTVGAASPATLPPALANSHTPAPGAAAAADFASGEVRRIDREQKKITLRHGEIRSLDMPPMSMVFNVRDAALLDTVAVGDRVRFKAEKVDGLFFVTAIEK